MMKCGITRPAPAIKDDGRRKHLDQAYGGWNANFPGSRAPDWTHFDFLSHESDEVLKAKRDFILNSVVSHLPFQVHPLQIPTLGDMGGIGNESYLKIRKIRPIRGFKICDPKPFLKLTPK